MRVLDLFSGIGGFSLGLERAGMETVAFCEIDPFCQKVLRKHWPDVPIYEDVREIDGSEITADLICGGYPCQPFSHAGKRAGEKDDRHLWPEMHRIIEAVRPRWVLAENVAGHISMGLDTVLSDLEGSGYTWWAFVIPACAVDARHRRDRVWIIAHTNQQRGSGYIITQPNLEQHLRKPSQLRDRERQAKPDVADTNHPRPQGHGRLRQRADELIAGPGDRAEQGTWKPEPAVGRLAHGIPGRVDRLRSLGNAVVPQVVEVIGRAIMECDRA